MSRKRVLIVNKSMASAGVELLRQTVKPIVLPYLDYDSESLPQIKQKIQGCDGLIWNTKHRLTPEILDFAGFKLKAISTISSGLDHVDLEEVKKRGIALGHTPQVLDGCVADIAVGLMIAAARRFREGIKEVESGGWKYGIQLNMGQDITGSTVGIVGLGGIGQAVVRRLRGFDIGRFVYSGRTDKPEGKLLGAERIPLEQLLKESDFIILACPLSVETNKLVNSDSLATMKKNAVIVNIGRGGLIDQEALYEALKNERIFAAGLDVVTPEPLPKEHPLMSLHNCYILPHIGSATIQTRKKMATIAAKNILQALEGKPMLHPVF